MAPRPTSPGPDDRPRERDVEPRREPPPADLPELALRSLDALAESVIITDAELERPGPAIVYANPSNNRMTGWPASEVLGRSPRMFQGPRTDREVLARLRRELEAGRMFFGQTWNYRRDGTPFMMRWQVAPVRDEAGRTTHYVAVQRDVTEQWRADEAFRRRTLELETIARHSPDAILRFAGDRRLVFASDATAALLGRDPDRLAGRRLDDWELPGDAAAAWDAALAHTLETGEARSIEIELPARGRFLDVRIAAESAGAAESGDGAPADHAVCFARDVTERVLAARARREAEERERERIETELAERELQLRDLAATVPVFVWMTDESGRVVFGNPAWLQFTGVHDEARPADWLDAVPIDERGDLERLLGLAAEQGRPVEHTCRVRHPSGAMRTVLHRATPMIAADGMSRGLIATSIDVTEQEEEERRRSSQRSEMERSARLVMAGQMATAMVHELSQPLGATANYIEAGIRQLERRLQADGVFPDSDESERLVAPFRDAQENAVRAGTISRKMLDFVRTSESDKVDGDLAEVVAKAVRLMRHEAEVRGVELIAPPAAASVPVRADPIRIEQVLCNLIRNAIESIDEAGCDVRWIRVETTVADGRAAVTVEDSGPGVPPERRHGLFDAFRTGKRHGLGLGLWICWNILEQHRGDIAYLDDAERSSFRFRLPLAPTPE